MNRVIAATTLRQRIRSPLRVALLALFVLMPLVTVLAAPAAGLAPFETFYPIVVILAAGMIGQDLASGTLQLLWARPVTRAEYVFSKWLAIAGGSIALSVMQLALGSLVLTVRGAPPEVRDVLVLAANQGLQAFGVAATMALLSSLASGLGDLGLLALAFITSWLLQSVGAARRWPPMLVAAEEIQRALGPSLDVTPMLAGTISWAAVLAYLGTIAACLAIAIVVMNRRELSYAST